MPEELPFPEGYYHYDKSEMLKDIESFLFQVKEGLRLGSGHRFEAPDIYYFGMGGSALAGDILKILTDQEGISLTVIKDYDIPKTIDKNSLLFFVSYSGNTEETLSCYKQAVRNFKNIISISSGGTLEKISQANRTKHILLPKNYQPRMSVPLQFFTLLKILMENNLIKNMEQEIQNLAAKINLDQLNRMGISLSEKLVDKIPLIYSSTPFFPVAYKWKTNFNENSKIMAFCNKFSELNHNEMVGYTMLKGPFYGVLLKNDDDNRRIMKRISLTKELMTKAGIEVTELGLKGHILNKVFTSILLSDYTSYYLGLRYKIDPAPVKIVEKFKKDLGPFV